VVAQQQAYVSDLEAVTGAGVGLFNPIVDYVQSGVRLVVAATVSADRKYVTFLAQPQFVRPWSAWQLPVFGRGRPANGNNTTATTMAAARAASSPANIQLPIINLTSVNTIVSVHDGGTPAARGQTLAGDNREGIGRPDPLQDPHHQAPLHQRSTAKDEQIC